MFNCFKNVGWKNTIIHCDNKPVQIISEYKTSAENFSFMTEIIVPNLRHHLPKYHVAPSANT